MLKAFVYRQGNHRIIKPLISSTFALTGVRAVKHHGARGRSLTFDLTGVRAVKHHGARGRSLTFEGQVIDF